MSHCYSVTIDIDGSDTEICTIVPGNESLKKDVEAGKSPIPTKEEIRRAINYHLKDHTHTDGTKSNNKSILHKIMRGNSPNDSLPGTNEP